VIAKSFAFIYGRNQPNLGLLGITITDESFYDVAVDGADIRIDLEGRKITVGEREWPFNLSAMEIKLIETGGITGAFRAFGKKLFEVMCAPIEAEKKDSVQSGGSCESVKEMQW
jgi:3-isopropylmalate dehydratase small subunit